MSNFNKLLFFILICSAFNGVCVEFNTDLLDASNRDSLNIKAFEVKGYFPKGEYVVDVTLNDSLLVTKRLTTYESDGLNHLCLDAELIESLNLKTDILKTLNFNQSGCFVDDDSLFIILEQPTQGKLKINVPSYMLQYTSTDWTSKKLWDYGEQAFTANYSFNSRTYGNDEINTTGFGDIGLNVGSVRLRGHYQYNGGVDFSGIHAYLPLIEHDATVSVGELYTSSDLLSSVNFHGFSFQSDESMLAPTERDYSPQITGYAKTNATVTIRHQGTIIYQTTVPQGNFTISDNNIKIRGTLDVEVEEQDGEIREFQVESSSLSGMLSPGDFEYSIDVGKSNLDYLSEQYFSSYSFGYGLANSVTLKNSSLISNNYINTAFEVYKDLYGLGSGSVEFAYSDYNYDKNDMHGISAGVNYSKSFDTLGTNITFAGYRYSQKQYTEFDEFLNINNGSVKLLRNQKQRTVINLSKNLPKFNSTIQLNLYNQSYWNADVQKRTSLMWNKSLDFFGAKNSQIDVTYTRQKDEFVDDNILSFNLTVPIDSINSRVSTDLEFSDDELTKSLRYSYYNNRQNVNVSARDNGKNNSMMMSYEREFDTVKAGVSLYNDNSSSSSISADISGSFAIVSDGVVFSPDSYGETKVVADVGVEDVNVNGSISNANGLALVSNVQPYYNNSYAVNVAELPDNVEFNNTVKKMSLVDGGVGIIHFDTIKGQKLLTHVYKNGVVVPFGASVYNSKRANLGMFSDNGLVFLMGMNVDEKYDILDGDEQLLCSFVMNEDLMKKNRIDCE